MIYKIALRVRNNKSPWCEVHVVADSIEAAIKKAVEEGTELNELDLVCYAASETDITIICG